MTVPRIALVLGGGGARGLAHIGVLAVLEEEGVHPAFLVGTSMGGVVAALSAAGHPAARIHELARGFRFPRWFVLGGLVTWDRIFAPAARELAGLTFDRLALPVAVVTVDLEAGRQVVLHEGPLLPALRATCAVPGVLPPIQVGGRWLVDGALVNALPVDVAAMADPDLVVAVRAGGHGPRPMPGLLRPRTVFSGIEILVRATEIVLNRQSTLATAMVEPHVLVDVEPGDIGIRDFSRLDAAVAAGREAAREALPSLRRALRDVKRGAATPERLALHVDPVCDMVVSPRQPAAVIVQGGRPLFFCSSTCRDTYLRRQAGRRE